MKIGSKKKKKLIDSYIKSKKNDITCQGPANLFIDYYSVIGIYTTGIKCSFKNETLTITT